MKASPTLGCLAALLLSGTAAAQSFTVVPNANTCADITPDGEIVVGTGNSQAYFWRWKVDAAPTYIGGRGATGVSADGTVITGDMDDPATGKKVAGRWTAATGWVPLGGVNGSCGSISSSYGIDDSGTKLTGFAWNSCSGVGYLWEPGATPTEMLSLESLANGSNRSSAISNNGAIAVGFAQGDSSRTPAWWYTDTKLGTTPNTADTGEYYGVNHDGSVLLVGRNGDGYYETWDAQLGTYVPTFIGGLNPGWSTAPTGISDNGGTIVGYDFLQGGGEAWVWNAQSGVMGLQTRLLSLGVPGVPYLGFATAISAKGDIVVGSTTFQNAWIAEIPPGPAINNYSCGFQNPPGSLVHLSGSSSIGGSFQLGVDDPTGSIVAPALGIVAFATAPDPNYPCGTPLPGFGMFSASADLLISLSAGNPFIQLTSGSLWTTPTNPVPVDLFLPLDTNLFGITIYAQGALFSPSTFKIGLTEGAEIAIGLD